MPSKANYIIFNQWSKLMIALMNHWSLVCYALRCGGSMVLVLDPLVGRHGETAVPVWFIISCDCVMIRHG